MGKVVDGRFQHGSATVNPPVDMERDNSTKKKSGGNSKADVAWLEEMADDLEELDRATLKALDLPWDLKYRWNGYADEVNPDFFLHFKRGTRFCTGAAYVRDERGGYVLDADNDRIMRPCLGLVMNGSTVCQKHGGQIGHVKNAAQVRLALAADRAAGTLVELTNVRNSEGVTIEDGTRLKAANSVLDRVGIRPGVEVSDDVPEYQKLLNELFTPEEEE